MRRYRPSYFIGQGFKGLWRNGVMSLASITVLLSCLVVMGCFALLLVNIDANLETIGDLNNIKVFVDSHNAHEEGETVILPDALTAEDPNVKFLGWSTTARAAQPDLKAGDPYVVSPVDALAGNVVFYAVWSNAPEVTQARVVYHACGLPIEGTLPVDETFYPQGAEVVVAPALTARYSTITFLGWSLFPDSDTVHLTPGGYYYMDLTQAAGDVVNLYAVWSQKTPHATYTMTYSTAGVKIQGEIPTDEGDRIGRIEAQIRSLENVADVVHTTPDEVMEEMIQKFRDAGYEDLANAAATGENPYRHEFSITYLDNDAVSTLEFQLNHIEGIAKVNCRTDYAEKIENLKHGVIVVFLWFMAILFVVSIFVIMNTVKLAVYARRQEISIMRYVGATNWFISLPFVVEGIIIGLLSSGLAYLVQYYMYKYVQKLVLSDINMVTIIPFADVKQVLLIGFIAIGVLTGVIGSSFSLRKYLKA